MRSEADVRGSEICVNEHQRWSLAFKLVMYADALVNRVWHWLTSNWILQLANLSRRIGVTQPGGPPQPWNDPNRPARFRAR